ncbi:MAG TPA: hypothetical protein VGP90_06065, partial [Acidimicrobiia bacterium]|nr:hypothetical protein [Acidimicrobiia bacterium]
ILVSLMQWGDKWTGVADVPPMELIHTGCGHRSAPRMVCDHCGEPVHARDVQPVTGPGWNDGEELAPHVAPGPRASTPTGSPA